MKTHTLEKFDKLLDLGNGHFYINFLVVETSIMDESGQKTAYEFESIEIDHLPNNEEIKLSLMAAGYSEAVSLLVAESDDLVYLKDIPIL